MELKQPSANQLKNWRKLLLGKYRKREQLFLAEGIRCVDQIIRKKTVHIEELLVERGSEFPEQLLSAGYPAYELSTDDFKSVSDTDTPQGVVAVCRTPAETDISVLTNSTGILVAFDAIQDPGNLGTMIRTAAWFNASGLLVGNGTVDPFHPKVVRSTAGATGTLPYLKRELSSTLPLFEENGWTVYILDGGKEARPIRSVSPDAKTILVIGNEGNGVDPKLFHKERPAVKIPGNRTNVESLNAAIAMSIALYSFSDEIL